MRFVRKVMMPFGLFIILKIASNSAHLVVKMRVVVNMRGKWNWFS